MRRLIKGAGVLAILGAAGFWIMTAPATLSLLKGSALPLSTGAADLANGETLFHAGGCTSCHSTENQPDKTRLGGGHGLKSPFGTFYVPNISSHPRDGIGSWTPEQFLKAMREGVSPQGEHYFPAFPYTSYQRMLPKDVSDLFAFLKTLPPVDGKIRDHDVSFPFNVRRLLGGWKLLFADGQVFANDASKSVEWNRGAYLVNGPGHCAECHSPRNPIGGIDTAKRFSGGPAPDGKGYVPNITPHANGIGNWTKKDIGYMLESGFTPDNDSVGGTMGPVIANMAKLTAADRNAIAEYIASLPAIEGRTKPK